MSSSEEIIQLEQVHKGFNVVHNDLDITVAKYLTLVKTIEDGSQTLKDHAISFQVLSKAQKETAETGKQLDALDKQKISIEQKIVNLETEKGQAVLKTQLAYQASLKASKDKLKADEAEEGSLVRMRQKLRELTAEYDKAGVRTKAAADEINKLSKEIQEAEFATNRHQRNVGNYADAIGGLSSPIGNAISSIQSMGKALWTLVANPIGATIAAIVGGLALLYKAFTSTDTGATKLQGALKAVGNVMDVLLDRAMAYYRTLWSLLTFDWEGVKKNGKEAFGGITQSIKDAVNAGWNYAQVMDDIEDREAASASRTAKLRLEIETLKNRAYTESGKIKMATLQEAMNKEIELNGIELGFIKEKNNAETMNLASMIQNSKLSIEQRAEQVSKWLSFDDTELNSMLEKDEAFRKFYDNNSDAFQKLQKSKSEELDKETEFQNETRRLQKGLATERNAELQAGIQAAKEAKEKEIENIEIAYAKEKEATNQKYITGLLSAEDYNDELLTKEEAYLKKKQALYKADSKEFTAIQLQLQQIAIKRIDEVKKHEEEAQKHEEGAIKQASELFKESLKEDEDAQKKTDDEFDKLRGEQEKKKEDDEKKANDKRLDMKEKIRDSEFQLGSDLINGMFDLGSAKRDEELNALEREKEKKLSNKNLTEAQKIKIEEEYQKKANAVKTKQAKADKLQALFNIALSTGEGIMKTIAEFGMPMALPLVAMVGALGALQAGLVAAQPIPKFAKGTKNAPDKGIFGEAGRELMFLRSGETMIAEQPTYFKGNKFKGAKILSNPETEKLIKMDHHSVGGRQMTDERLLNEMKLTRKAILNKPVIIMDKENRVIGQKTSHSQEIYLNRLIRQ